MKIDQWQRVREIFEAALERQPADLAGWVSAQTANVEVRAEVLSLLDHHSRAGAFLSEPVVERNPDLLADDEPLAPGTVVGPYTIVRELGRGGMGRVYLASDSRLGRTVALKALAPRLVGDPAHRDRLRREARAAAVLTHPGICTVYALEEFGGDLFIATEFVDGHTLREEIAGDHRPSAAQIVATARELAAALASAHAKGITHRDLKPENVMRTTDGRLKILDFGLARFEIGAGDGPTRTVGTLPGVLLGTPAYMAPEQLNGGTVDARSDVFAFGVLMYEYACGVHPFHATTQLALLARVLESDAYPLEARCPQLPTAVANVIDRCLRKPPAERYANAGEILDAIARDLPSGSQRRSMTWWRIHQLAVMGLYVIATTIAWNIKESYGGWLPTWLFMGMGIGAAFAGIIRGHLLFTEQMNRSRLIAEWERAKRANMIIDLLMAAALFLDGFVVAQTTPLWAMLTMALAVGIALAAILMEPATTAAALGTEHSEPRTRSSQSGTQNPEP